VSLISPFFLSLFLFHSIGGCERLVQGGGRFGLRIDINKARLLSPLYIVELHVLPSPPFVFLSFMHPSLWTQLVRVSFVVARTLLRSVAHRRPSLIVS
jgi:hypothetical protein